MEHFAAALPALTWQPSEYCPGALTAGNADAFGKIGGRDQVCEGGIIISTALLCLAPFHIRKPHTMHGWLWAAVESDGAALAYDQAVSELAMIDRVGCGARANVEPAVALDASMPFGQWPDAVTKRAGAFQLVCRRWFTSVTQPMPSLRQE